ncbi:hypothetical protein R1sor_022823 [Riccia sorocarpa]|uniref:DNA mismatch repair proteins mutS family domain-containing protein n=1 Tax=Riccia sorocarpa TaxID=122646 RepID=A0ABD3GNZ5_9MARC
MCALTLYESRLKINPEGCYVPGEACVLSHVDTIFTRLMATDRIMAGESTFMVECNEASSVFHKLVSTLDCHLIFATHYHALTEEFAANPYVCLHYMACAFQSRSRKGENNSSGEDDSDLDKELVFLYKLTEGSSPKSFGLQVALRVGIPTSVVAYVVKSAHCAAQSMQESLSHAFCMDDKSAELGANMKQLLRTVLQAGHHRAGLESSSRKNQTHEQLLGAWQTLQKGQDAVKG